MKLYLKPTTILLLIFSSFMSVGWGQCNGCNPGRDYYYLPDNIDVPWGGYFDTFVCNEEITNIND